MNVEEMKQYQADFEHYRKGRSKAYREFENLRESFVNKFSIQKIENLSKEEFALGKKEVDKDTFCYMLEFATAELGRINGSTSKKYGLYIDKKTQEFKFTKTKYNSPDDAIEKIRQAILDLIKYGKANEIENLKAIKLANMFKGKILFMYYPEIFLNIFATDYVDFFLKKIGLFYGEKKLDVIEKRALLVEFKNNDPVMKKWSMFEFTDFLYFSFGGPKKQKDLPVSLKEYADEIYPDLITVNPNIFEIIDIGFSKFSKTANESTNKNGEKTKRSPRNFMKENKLKTQRGEFGEQIVIKFEREKLKKVNRLDLMDKVTQVSKNDSSAGYDILSFDENGKEMYIEVKATVDKYDTETAFYISEGEKKKAESLENYYLYRVFDITSKNPTILRIKNPAQYFGKEIQLIPSNYQGYFKLKDLK